MPKKNEKSLLDIRKEILNKKSGIRKIYDGQMRSMPSMPSMPGMEEEEETNFFLGPSNFFFYLLLLSCQDYHKVNSKYLLRSQITQMK